MKTRLEYAEEVLDSLLKNDTNEEGQGVCGWTWDLLKVWQAIRDKEEGR